MAFDFPATPTTGQIYQPTGGPAWQYDGEKWKGGAIAGPQKETLIDYSGKSSVNVDVPTWAKSCLITMFITPTAAGNMAMRVSGDGTTFLSGVNDYSIVGPWHQSSPAAFATIAQQNQSQMPLSINSATLTVAHTITVEFQLERLIGNLFSFKSQATSYNATPGLTTAWFTGYVGAVLAGVTKLKALQFFGLTGVAGSHIHIKWLGDDAQIPTQNAIPDAPSDGGEYVRVNGVWRLKEQGFDIAGKTVQDITVPALAKSVEINSSIFLTAIDNPNMRFSFDGTTFGAGATDYANSAATHMSGAAAPYATIVEAVNSIVVLGSGGDNFGMPNQITTVLNVTRPTTSQIFSARSYSRGFWNAIAQRSQLSWWAGYYSGTNTALGIKAIRVMMGLGVGSAFGAGSTLNVRWLY